MKLGYARVSTKDQELSLADQDRVLREQGCERVFTDVISGARSDRPGFAAMLDQARDGDVIVVTRLDRLGRSAVDTLRTIEELDSHGVSVQALDQDLDTSTATGRLVVAVLVHLAEWERDLIRERTKAGLAEARRRGRVPGGQWKMTQPQRDRAWELLQQGATVPEVAAMYDVHPQTIYRIKWEREHGDDASA